MPFDHTFLVLMKNSTTIQVTKYIARIYCKSLTNLSSQYVDRVLIHPLID